jgi:two-component system response regulator YesN
MINQNILIVEDELGVAHPLKKALDLSPNKLYQVELCSSGEAALERLRNKRFDLLISDFRLPGMDVWNCWSKLNRFLRGFSVC